MFYYDAISFKHLKNLVKRL